MQARETSAGPDAPKGASKDSANDRHLRWLADTFDFERSKQAENRIERAIDEDFEDGIQWTAEERQELDDRGQPCLTYNECKPVIEWIIGTEKRLRTDWRIAPRAEDDVKPALAKTKLFKYVSDINQSEYQQSLAFADAVRSGDGWTRFAVRTNDRGRPEIVHQHCSWREFWPDSRDRSYDGQGMKYLHRSRYVDLDESVSLFPQHEAALTATAQDADSALLTDDIDGVLEQEFENNGGMFSSTHGIRQVVRLNETWYRKPEKVKVLRSDDPRFDGVAYDKGSFEHAGIIAAGTGYVVDTIKKVVRVSLWADNLLIYDQPSPYKHDRFPYIRRIAYRRKRDGMVYGVIRQLRDPQSDMNKRISKAQYALNTIRVIYEKGAIEDPDKVFDELARTDSAIELAHGAMERFKLIENGEIARGQLEFADRDSAYIRMNAGVTGENLGLSTNATTGVAIKARQEQGTVTTFTLYDNHRIAKIVEGKVGLSLIEQFMTEKMQLRITGERNKDEFFVVNDGTPETDITAQSADFIVAEQDWNHSIRAASAAEIFRVAGTLPPQQAMLLTIIGIELLDLPKKDEMVKEIRKATGIPNPDATPEEAQAEQEAERQRNALQMAMTDAELRKAKADAALAEVRALSEKVKALSTSIAAAGDVAGNPTLARAADDILRSIDSLLNPAANGLPDQRQPATVQATGTPPQQPGQAA